VTVQQFATPTPGATPITIVSGLGGDLWFTESNVDQIGRVSPQGIFSEFALPAGSGPQGITEGPVGQGMWVTAAGSNMIADINVNDVFTEFAVPTSKAGLGPITVGPDGNLWFVETNVGQIGTITLAGVVTEFKLPTGATPQDIVTGPDGNLWFTDSGLNRIGRLTTSGTLTEFAVPTPSSALGGITAGPDGNLWFTEIGANNIGRITTNGVVKEFPIPTSSAGPTSITLAPDNNLWFTETGASQLGEITNITTAPTISEFGVPPATGGSAATPLNIAPGPDGNLWYTDNTNSLVVKVIEPHYIVTGPDFGGGPDVRVFDSVTGAKVQEFYAYDPHFLGGVRVAVGNLAGTGHPYIVTAPGPSGGPDIRVFDLLTGKKVAEFMAYTTNFTGGVYVAVADVNGDGFADIITSPDFGGGPEVKVFSGKALLQKNGLVTLQDFYAYASNMTNGVRVAAGDVNGDGFADIITSVGQGPAQPVEVFSGASPLGPNPTPMTSFFAYDSRFRGGVFVAAGDVNGDGDADIITGAGAGGGPQVEAFSGKNGALLQSFYAYSPSFPGGVRVAALDTQGDGFADIITGPGFTGGPQVNIFDGTSLSVLDSYFAYNPGFQDGIFVAGF
jgi:streptogramin lyase